MRAPGVVRRLVSRPEVRAAGGDAGAPASWWDLFTAASSTWTPVATRDEAMTVPAVAGARKLICETIGQLDLHQYAGSLRVDLGDELDTIATDPNPAVVRSVFYSWLADDLLFRGQGTLVVTARSASTGAPTRLRRVLPGQVVYTPTADAYGTPLGPVLYNGRSINPADVIVIPGPNEGLLTYGRVAIATALAYERTAKLVADVPIPPLELHQTGGEALTDDEIDALLDGWIEARRARGVAYTNDSIEAKDHGWSPRELSLVEARQQSSLEIARLTGLEASSLGAQVPGSTLTYQNAQQVREGNWLNAIRQIASPIAETLTRVCLPHGRVYRFNADQYTTGTIFDRLEMWAKAVAEGLVTVDEARAFEGWPAIQRPASSPADDTTPAPPATAGV